MPSTSAARSSLVRDESVNAEVRRSMDESASALNRGDVETILRTYAPDAVLLPPNSPGVQGIMAIRQLWESFLASGFCNAALEFDQIEHWGDVAIAIGRYKVQISVTPGTFEVDRGKYASYLRRMEDGQFRVTMSMWYSDRWQRLNHP